MKNKISNDRLSYFFTPRIHGNVLAWVRPASASENGKRVHENILRWEDDGGNVLVADEQPGQNRMRLGNGQTNDGS